MVGDNITKPVKVSFIVKAGDKVRKPSGKIDKPAKLKLYPDLSNKTLTRGT